MQRAWLIRKDPDAGKAWRQKEKGTTEDEMTGWHHWPSGHEFEQTLGDGEGQGGLVCCSPWGLKQWVSTEQPNNNTHVSLFLNLPPPLLTPLGCHRAQILTPVSKPQILTAYVTYGNIYASVLLSIQRTLSFPHCGHESVVYVWISTAALQIGSSLLFFQIPYIYSKIWYMFFSFWLTSLYITVFYSYTSLDQFTYIFKCTACSILSRKSYYLVSISLFFFLNILVFF